MRVPLPLVDVWEQMQAEVERLAGEVGLRILWALLEDEVMQKVGPRTISIPPLVHSAGGGSPVTWCSRGRRLPSSGRGCPHAMGKRWSWRTSAGCSRTDGCARNV